MLELENISKRYGDLTVLEPTTLSIAKGQTVVLIGPSGCGKSTLLRMIIGLITPDSGHVKLDGTLLTSETVNTLRHSMGYVLQDGGLFPHLSAYDNVAIMARHLERWNNNEIHARIEQLAALTKLPIELLSRFPGQISGGQRQRVAIMRGLMLDPPVLLLDEPMGALDPLVRYDLQEDLKEIFRNLQKTVVLVTHDMGEAAFFANDVLLMAHGKIAQRGAIEDFLDSPASDFVSRFIRAQRFPKLN
ncbi:MAG: ATP-binding cassette domain-containing protein [Planctomycetales bacterium]|nr:ATP-binding cassette domain-containing protein [Planctomycetales bacterium]